MGFLKRLAFLFLFLVFVGVVLNATNREQKIEAVKTANVAIKPAAEAYVDFVQDGYLEIAAGSDGPMGQAAKSLIGQRDLKERQENRGPRQSMQDCIKPDSLIDQDVKDCMEGLTIKTW
jgi:cbb3-type cytochrome oxidase subunit 3